MTLQEWIDQLEGLAEIRSALIDWPATSLRILRRLKRCKDALEQVPERHDYQCASLRGADPCDCHVVAVRAALQDVGKA